MRLYSSVDLTGNVNKIEKIVLGGNRGTPDGQPDTLTSSLSSHAVPGGKPLGRKECG